MSDRAAGIITDEIRAMIGREATPITSCDEVSTGDIRRFVQAIMDDSAIFYDAKKAAQTKYGGCSTER